MSKLETHDENLTEINENVKNANNNTLAFMVANQSYRHTEAEFNQRMRQQEADFEAKQKQEMALFEAKMKRANEIDKSLAIRDAQNNNISEKLNSDELIYKAGNAENMDTTEDNNEYLKSAKFSDTQYNKEAIKAIVIEILAELGKD